MLIRRDPKHIAIVALTQRQSGNNCCMLLKLWTCPRLDQRGHPEWDRSFLEPVSWKRQAESPTAPWLQRYPMMRKASFTQYNDFGPFSGDKLERARVIKWRFAQGQISKTLVYLKAVDSHSNCYKMTFTIFFVDSQRQTTPIHRLFEYAGGSKRGYLTKLLM